MRLLYNVVKVMVAIFHTAAPWQKEIAALLALDRGRRLQETHGILHLLHIKGMKRVSNASQEGLESSSCANRILFLRQLAVMATS